MDFMKVFDQTVREIKREVNLKVLKVPEIEQKVLDATDNEPWGPHGTALAEIAEATKKFSECQMVMNVLWTRLGETGKDWRYVYKALAVIEYLISHGSERAVDDIIEHTFQISSLSSFEYVEPSGKDMGINVRKKSENIVALLNNRDKIQEARNKAAANREKYFGLSSTGITYKSGSATYGTSSFQSSDRYGGSREVDNYSSSYRDGDQYGEEKIEKDTFRKSHRGAAGESQGNTLKKGSGRYGSKDQDNMSSKASKLATKANDSDNYSTIRSQSASVPSNDYDDDFDDFDPRGISESTAGSSKQVDLFGDSLIGDLMDPLTSVPAEISPVNGSASGVDLFADATFVSAKSQPETGATVLTSVPVETSALNGSASGVDLFADVTFVSANSQPETGANSHIKGEVDLFASRPAASSAVPAPVDLFAAAAPVVQPVPKAPKSEPMPANIVDPFAAVPLNSFNESDLFGAFTSDSNSRSTETLENTTSDSSLNYLGGKSSAMTVPVNKKDNFQVKSGIWADSLSRGLIDLNISAPKKVSLADIGVVGGLSDGSDEREKGPPTSFNMGRAMGTGSGLGKSGFTSPPSTGGDELFSNFGGFNK